MQLKGIAAAPGIAIGNCIILEEIKHPDFSLQRIGKNLVKLECEKLTSALKTVEKQLENIMRVAESKELSTHSEIIKTHIMMLQDIELTNKFYEMIQEEYISAAGAVQKVIKEQSSIFENLDNVYFCERSQDIRDIGRRIVNVIIGINEVDVSCIEQPVILVGHDIPPSIIATVDQENLLGIISETGGKTSHTAILANNMGVPAVFGCQDVVKSIREIDMGVLIAIDGNSGSVNIGINDEQAKVLQLENLRRQEINKTLQLLREQKTITKDGVSVRLVANAMNEADIERIQAVGGEGVGLYRTEFLFMDRSCEPDEEEQYTEYRTILEGMKGKPVVIRTLDVGGDKSVEYLGIDKEENPFLGYRALRICLDRKELFLTQLRAILRAGVHGQAMLMLPMVCSLDEIRSAKELIFQAKQDLQRRGVEYAENIPLGIMIEIPSAAIIADVLIEEVDFFSIGSNDLIQYTLAVDRMNQKISYLYNGFHPAVIRLIKKIIDSVCETKGNKFVSMCGEMAGDPRAAILLLGLGLREFSVSPNNLLRIRKIINSIDFSFAENVAQKALKLKTTSEIEEWLSESMPDDLKAFI